MILSSVPAAPFTKTAITLSSVADPISAIFERAEVSPFSLAQALKGLNITQILKQPHRTPFHFKIQFVFLLQSLTQAYSIKSSFSFILLSSFHLPTDDFFGVFYTSSHHFWYKKLLTILPFGTTFLNFSAMFILI